MGQFIRALDEVFYRKSDFKALKIITEYEESGLDSNGLPIENAPPRKATGFHHVEGWFDGRWILLGSYSSHEEARDMVENF